MFYAKYTEGALETALGKWTDLEILPCLLRSRSQQLNNGNCVLGNDVDIK